MQHREWISRYRDELKGLAILWVVFFHSPLALPGQLDLLRTTGYGGVDILLFLMGMGLYHSLKRQSDLREYLSRRLWRLLPSYYPLVMVWMAVQYTLLHYSATQVMRGVAGNLTLAGYWLNTPGQLNWFPSVWLLMMLLAPVAYALLSKSGRPGRMLAALLAISLGMGVAAVGTEQMMGISRLPVFLLGLALGIEWKTDLKRGWVRAGYLVAFVAGLLLLWVGFFYKPELQNYFGLYWYPFALMAPGLCVFGAWVMEKTARSGKLLAFLRIMGRASFEIFLVNMAVYQVLKNLGMKNEPVAALYELAGIALGYGYYQLVQGMTPGLKRWTERRLSKGTSPE